MTGGDEFHSNGSSPWWVEYDKPPNEPRFVSEVSGALSVPNAAPEIRMIAEVMAVMSIPEAETQLPRPAMVPSPFLVGRQAEVVALDSRRHGRGARRLLAVGTAAAIALVGVTVSAYAGMLPASVQDVAHHVINAPKGHKNSDGGSNSSDQNGRSTPGGPGATGSAGNPHGSTVILPPGAATHPSGPPTGADAAATETGPPSDKPSHSPTPGDTHATSPHRTPTPPSPTPTPGLDPSSSKGPRHTG